MILVDTSALGKLLVEETESPALRDALSSLSRAGERFLISALATTELRRLAIRLELPPESVEPVLAPFDVLRVTEGILQLAGRLPYRNLGTLDAIHVATALVAEVSTVVTYDLRMQASTRGEGLSVLHPGRIS